MYCSLEGRLFYDVDGCVLKVGDHKNKVTLRRVLYDLFCWQEVNTNWLVLEIDLVTIK